MEIFVIEKEDSQYPLEFKAIGEDAPDRIYALGNIELLNHAHKVAIIGSRKATLKGEVCAYQLGQRYAENGYVVVSGLALGCDTAAHKGCLAARGKTIAIVGSGLGIVHPKENKALQQQILECGGLILSECPFLIKANPTRLIARNRLQAALSEKVIVAECPLHSGTMHTVRFAQQYGKPISAVKYEPWNESNSGNKLIIEVLGLEEDL